MPKFDVGDVVVCITDDHPWTRRAKIKTGDGLEVVISEGKAVRFSGKPYFHRSKDFELASGIRYEDEEI